LDGASPRVFEEVKGSKVRGPYKWKRQIDALLKAVHVFGKGNISTHIIVGLGETDREVADLAWRMNGAGVLASLFAFTPLEGTMSENRLRPSLARYRLLQAINFLINEDELAPGSVMIDDEDRVKKVHVSKRGLEILRSGEPFRTFGCSGCNKDHVNEKFKAS